MRSLYFLCIFLTLIVFCKPESKPINQEESIPAKGADSILQEPDDLGIVLTDSGLNLRESPSVSASLIRTLKKGEQVKIVSESRESIKIGDEWGHWINVQVSQSKGWVFSANKFFITTKYEKNKLYINEKVGTDVYEFPSQNAKVLRTLKVWRRNIYFSQWISD